MTVAVQDRRPPRVPYDMMVRVTADALQPGDYLPLQLRLVESTERLPDGNIRLVTRPLFRQTATRTYVWPPKTPVMMLPSPN